jgi:putative ATPase
MARMLDGGEDPMTLFRRAIAMAAEGIGLADPNALLMAVAARDAFHMLGPPEGYLPLAEMTIYLATAPKSNSAKVALGAALAAAQETPAAPVPMHIRNAPTGLMKELGYGRGYRYAHDSPDAYLPQEYLPDALRGAAFYVPGVFGHEKRVAERMEWWARKRAEAEGAPTASEESRADRESGEAREGGDR